MKALNQQVQRVQTILRNWRGSDAGEASSAQAVAQEVDQVYADYITSLPAQTLLIRKGQEECERKAA